MSNAPMKVVVVDDNYDDIQIIITTLEYYSIDVHAVDSAEACVEASQNLVPDLIITDLAMPGADGWDVLRALRADARTAAIPVVAMTAYHSARLEDEVMKQGFNGYIPKPIDPSELVSRLRVIMGV